MSTEAQFIISAKERTKPAFDQIKRNLQIVEKQSARTQSAISKVMAPLSAYVAFAGVRRLTTDFGTFEEAVVKVGKTANLEGENLKKFGKDIQDLKIPIATKDLLEYGEAAGQLGIKGSDNLLKFVDTMARLEKSSDLVGEKDAKGIARVINVTGEGIETVDRFGSVLVALGNNFAASESEILGHTTEVSRAIAIYDVGAAQAAAFGASMASLGIRAESGGSVVGRSFNAMNIAITQGGEKLTQLMAITGMTEQQLKTTFKDNAEGVFQSFLTGLNKIDKSGGDMIVTLENFGLKGEEVNKTLPVMAKNSSILASAMKLANKEVANATALTIESNKAFATQNAALKLTEKALSNVSIEIGQRLSPAITGISSGLREWIGDTDDISNSVDTLSNVALAGLVGVTARYTVSAGIATQAKITDIIATNTKIKAEQLATVQKISSAKTEYNYALAVYNSTKAQKLAAIGTAQYTSAAKLEQVARAGLTASIKTMQVAQSQHNAVMVQGTLVSRTLASSMALLGGPAGVVMLATGALTYFISSSSEASEKTKTLGVDVDSLTKKYKTLSSLQLNSKLLDITDSLATQKQGISKLTGELDVAQGAINKWAKVYKDDLDGLKVKTQDYTKTVIRTEAEKENATIAYNNQLALQAKLKEQIQFIDGGGKPITPESTVVPVAVTPTNDPTAALKRQQLDQQYTDLQTALMSEDELLFQTANKRNVLLAELWQASVITDADKFQALASINNEQYLAKLDAIEAQEIARNESKLIRMDEQWLAKSEKLDAQHLAEAAQYQALFDKKTITEVEYEERKKKLNTKYKKEHDKLEKAEQKSKLVMNMKGSQQLLALVGQNSSKLFKLTQLLNVGEMIMDTNKASVRALAELGPIAGPPVAAGIEAWGYGMAAATGAMSLFSGKSGGSTPPSNTEANPGLENTLSTNINANNSPEKEPVRNYFIVEGDLIGNSVDVMFEQMKEKIETTDAVLIEPGTRQARELT
tara:strand:- start:3560 stop:6526 length:2967 start_codon:yes stop_codon:yes gene_type:complete